ncbi:hypothetical protein CHLRE_05g242180v5 [Chlamydomonas reinhardtii]|uniref:Uncharacterized protein n=1 Tax=Chlamydomonas reinhardtii TaxID=3055 RepID=A0A2K3DSG2_CHLRE|nr:uncharacterized protein CHLRE_05g242180v5 [Chlamydomonas reinhardtii]PNW83473.1 hypothetical protein CHLRE_05g242180v5 [Chlamydomonas reinhardtii]
MSSLLSCTEAASSMPPCCGHHLSAPVVRLNNSPTLWLDPSGWFCKMRNLLCAHCCMHAATWLLAATCVARN